MRSPTLSPGARETGVGLFKRYASQGEVARKFEVKLYLIWGEAARKRNETKVQTSFRSGYPA
jgi:hypothetical protein